MAVGGREVGGAYSEQPATQKRQMQPRAPIGIEFEQLETHAAINNWRWRRVGAAAPTAATPATAT